MSQQPPIEQSNFNNNTNSAVSEQNSPTPTQTQNSLIEQPQPDKPAKKSYNLLIGMIVGIVGTIVAMSFINPQQPNSESSTPVVSETTSTNISQSITTATAEVMDVESKVEATGTVLAYELVPVMSQANSLQIKTILVDEGDSVKQGQVVMRLDDAVLQAELRQAQAGVQQTQARLAEIKAGSRIEEIARAKENINVVKSEIAQAQADLNLAKVRLQRNRTLQAEGAISRDRLDEVVNDELVKRSSLQRNQARLREAQQQLQQLQQGARVEVVAQSQASVAEAQARVNLIKTRLKDTIVTAPVGGIIAQRNARVGDIVSGSSGRELLTIIQNGRLELEVKVPETQLQNITAGQKVQISTTANPNLNLTGIVRDINPVIEQESRQAIINVDLPTGAGLKPGMFVQADIVTTTSARLTVPIEAVIPQNNGIGRVFLVQDNQTVKAQQVELGEIIDNNTIEIKSGLQPQDTIAVKGVNYLQDGSRIIENP